MKINEIIDSGILGDGYEGRLARNNYQRRDDWQTIWDSQICRTIRAESAKMEHICQLRSGNKEVGA